MLKIAKIYPRDIIAIVVLLICFFLIYSGVDTFITAITAVIIGYYFSKRVYEEMNPNGDLKEKVKEIEEEIKQSVLRPSAPFPERNASAPASFSKSMNIGIPRQLGIGITKKA